MENTAVRLVFNLRKCDRINHVLVTSSDYSQRLHPKYCCSSAKDFMGRQTSYMQEMISPSKSRRYSTRSNGVDLFSRWYSGLQNPKTLAILFINLTPFKCIICVVRNGYFYYCSYSGSIPLGKSCHSCRIQFLKQKIFKNKNSNSIVTFWTGTSNSITHIMNLPINSEKRKTRSREPQTSLSHTIHKIYKTNYTNS